MKALLTTMKSVPAKLLLVTCLCAAHNFAQAADVESRENVSQNEGLKFVPTLGYSFFNITGTDVDYKSKSGSSASMLVQKGYSPNLTLESGLQYLEAGAKQSLDFGFFSLDTAVVDIKMLTIPVRAQYVFNPAASGARYYGKAGLAMTYIVSAKTKVMGETQDIKSELNSLGAFAQAGLGADWEIASASRLNFDVTYNYGLTKLSKNEGGKLAGLELQAGYAIPF